MAISLGVFKQEFSKIVNKVYVDNFQNGLALCNIIIEKNLVIQTGISKHLPCLEAFAKFYPGVEQLKLESMIQEMLKIQIKNAFEEFFGINVVSVFKDYDPTNGNTLCVLQLEKNVEMYLEKISLS